MNSVPAIPEYNYLHYPKGLKSWLLTRDHKRIGVMYFVAIMTFFVAGGLLAIAMRTELLSPHGLMMSS
ncbi:cytochrome c oxidase subunit I, partial [candidate division GN15 bacterium]